MGAAQAARRPAPLRVEDGLLVNTRAQYYLAVPPGWTLDGKSDYRDVAMLHSASSSTFTISFKRAPNSDLRTEYQNVIAALKLLGVRSVRGGGEGLAIDGRPAMSITYTSPRAGTEISQWLVRDGEVAFEIVASIPQPQGVALAPDIAQIMNSFKWGNRDKQP